jgi:choline-sulfatase
VRKQTLATGFEPVAFFILSGARLQGSMSRLPFFVLLVLLGGIVPRSFAASPNIVLITIDTTRADRMGFLGSSLGLTPNLDRLARGGVVFSNAYSQVPLTTASHAVILTGTYPQFNHMQDMGTALAKSLPYLPDILHRAGYRTAAFVGSQVLDPKGAAAPGFDRGFDTYDAGFHSRAAGEDRYHSVERRGDVVVAHAIRWLDKSSPRPFFLWVHLYDPHDPYDPPAPYKTKYASDEYNGEIAYADAAVGKLLGALRTRGVYEGSVIAVMADHGEAFGEHGERGHGIFLYDETLHVPLVMKLPTGKLAGARVQGQVQLVDVAPTLLRLAGLPLPAAVQGRSLLDLAARNGSEKKNGEDWPAYAETDYPRRAFGWSALEAWRTGKYLYVQAPRKELYDVGRDPAEAHNIARDSGAVADTLASELADFRQKTSNTSGQGATLSPQLTEQLQALGYVASAGKTEETSRGIDPKDKIEIANLMHEGLLEVDEGQYEQAIPHLEKVLNDQPQLGLAALALGEAWNRTGKPGQAVPWLRKAVQLNPESGRAHDELGIALSQVGDWAAAVPEFEAAVARAPEAAELNLELADAYEQVERMGDAQRVYEGVLQRDAGNFQANLLLGRLLGMQNQPKAALAYLQKAIRVKPSSADAHKMLANVYTELGRNEEASRERAEAARLDSQQR